MSENDRNKLSDPLEHLLRQVHPNFYVNGRISSQAFEATQAHDFFLSVSQASLTSARHAFELYTNDFGLSSACVCTVTVGEVEAVDLSAYHEPTPATPDTPADPAHAIIDMSKLPRKQRKKRAGSLAKYARDRGVTFEP